MSGHILQHINDLVAERDALKAELARLQAELSSPARFLAHPRVVVQAATPEEAAHVAAFLIGQHNLPVTLEVISADVAEENRRLRGELEAAQKRIRTLQTNLLGVVGLDCVYVEEN